MHSGMDTLKIAVIGGGIAGTTLANGLMKHAHIDFDVYEAGPAFKEKGASVGLNGPCQRALEIIGNNVRRTIDRAGGVVSESTRLLVASGPDQGKFIVDVSDKDKTMNVHRVEFLKELLDPVPESRLHTNKKLVRIENLSHDAGTTTSTTTSTTTTTTTTTATENGTRQYAVRVHFADGTSSDVDGVIGCDGIHSTVRRFIMGEDHPQLKPVFAGFWDFRNLVPASLAQEKMGRQYFNPDEPRQIGWIGKDGFMLHQLIDDGRTAALICAGRVDQGDGNGDALQWKKPLTREKLEAALGGRGEFGKHYMDCIMMAKEPLQFSQWMAGTAPTYTKDRMLMIGDAAHATTPWHGSGAGFAIEDAAMLQALLGAATRPEHLPAVFEAFNEARYQRTQQLIWSSHMVGKSFMGHNPDIGLDWEKMAEKVPRMWDFIYDIDMRRHVDDAVEGLKVKLEGGVGSR